MTALPDWSGDVLQRKEAATFLYRVIQAKVATQKKSGQDGALCIAVDGDWGVGKTFFVERWAAELAHAPHPVVRFDAWKNDLADDPLIAFISVLRESLKPWISQLPILPQAKRALTSRVATVVKQAAKATLPLTVSIATNVSARYAGDAALGILKDVLDTDSGNDSDDKKEKLSPAKLSEKALQKFFEASLKQHQGKQAAISELVSQIEGLVEYMETQPIQLPFFIFIDELDRCRPDYAIRLLEGMKHLFNAKGVCFIVTTNLLQLSEAIKVVYGNNFNGYGYLKRFFDFEYQLPIVEGLAYAEHLIEGSTLASMKLQTGIYMRGDRYASKPVSLAKCFDFVARLFELSLRSQRQVLLQAEAAALSLPSENPVHVFFLLCLTAIAHKNPAMIDAINAGKTDIYNTIEALPNLSFSYYDADRRADGDPEKAVFLRDLFKEYFRWSIMKKNIMISDESMNSGKYPYFIGQNLFNEKSNASGNTSLFEYSKCVRLAGQISR